MLIVKNIYVKTVKFALNHGENMTYTINKNLFHYTQAIFVIKL